MTDFIDRACDREQTVRDAEIEAARKPKPEPATHQTLDGDIIICACCGDPIPLERLKYCPETTLCACCKSFLEKS